jgi:addiction module HigA family antidote
MTQQHPGRVLLEQHMTPQNISQNRLARAIKVPPRRINEIIHGKRGITADTAVRLAIYFGGSATYWTHLQAEYEIEKVKQNIAIQLSTIQPPLQTHQQADVAQQVTTLKQSKSSNLKSNSLKKRIMR